MNRHDGTPSAGNGAHRNSAETAHEALQWAVKNGAAPELVRRARRRDQKRTQTQIAAGGCALAALVVGLWMWRPAEQLAPAASPGIAARMIRPETRTLSDGSVVELRPGASIAVEFDAAVRRIVLVSGEAHFDVRPDATRPFVVAVAGVEVRAVGTAFCVGYEEQKVAVIVTHGRVSVEPPASSSEPAVTPAPGTLLDAGYGAIVEVAAGTAPAVPVVTQLSATALSRRLTWRVPLLEFAGTPLRDVVPLFNAHGGTRLVFDPALGGLKLSGSLRANDVESLLMVLRDEFGVAAVRQSDGTTRLERR